MPINPRYLPQLYEGRDAPLLSMDVKAMTGGMNTKLHPTELEDNQAVLLENVIISLGGVALKRDGATNVLDTVTPTGPFIGLGRWNPPITPQAELLLCAAQGGIYDWDGDASWRTLTGGSFSGEEPVYFVQGQEILPSYAPLGWFFQRGASAVYEYDGTTTLTTASGAGSGLANSIPTGVDAEFWLGRLWVAEDGANNGYIRYSTFGEPTKFDTSTGFLVNPNDDVMRIIQWFNTGLIIFQRNQIWALDIDQANFEDLTFDSTRMEVLNTDIGTVAGKSVAQAGQDFFFLSRFGVMQLSKTDRDKAVGRARAISDPISATIRTINWNEAHKSRAVVFDRWYLLAVPTGSSTVVDTVLAYDLWESAWTTFSGWSVGDFQVTNFPTSEEKLYFATADVSGDEVYEAFDELATDDDGVAISGTVTTPRYDFGTTDKLKTFCYCDVYAESASGGTIEVWAGIDNEEPQKLGEMDVAADLLTVPFILTIPAPRLGGGAMNVDRFELTQLETGREIQFKFVMTGAAATKLLYFTVVAQAWEQAWAVEG